MRNDKCAVCDEPMVAMRSTRRTCSGRCRVALLRRRRGSVARAPKPSHGGALDFDGFPRLGGGKRFWRELNDAVFEKVVAGLDLADYREHQVQYDVKTATAALRQKIKIAVAEAVADLQGDAANLRTKAKNAPRYFVDASRRKVSEAFRVFNLDRSATLAKVKTRFREAMMYYHPDANPSMDPEKAKEMIAHYTEAYAVLKAHFQTVPSS